MLNIFIFEYKIRPVVKCVIVINNESVIYGKADVGGVDTEWFRFLGDNQMKIGGIVSFFSLFGLSSQRRISSGI